MFLAARWRQRICDRFRDLLFKSPHGCVLYETAQSDEDLPKVITNDVKQFTTNFAAVLFGSMFFPGVISVFAVIIIACTARECDEWRRQWHSHLFRSISVMRIDDTTQYPDVQSELEKASKSRSLRTNLIN